MVKMNIKFRSDLKCKTFPIIWLELKQQHKRNILVCGFYREWSNDGLLNVEDQLKAIKELTTQIEAADNEEKKL